MTIRTNAENLQGQADKDTSTGKSLQQSWLYPITYAMDGPSSETGIESIWKSADYKSM
ncbi:hypothetical protein BFINE_13020 [Bacteroides finegoldii DSM 17565]|nr:hypothetical protein BFINE_13020 [Bacteroides finegoldii DSM 17565]